MKSTPTPAPKPLSPAGEKLREMLREIYAPIEWASDEVEEAGSSTITSKNRERRNFFTKRT
jgi:hypothetical protein